MNPGICVSNVCQVCKRLDNGSLSSDIGWPKLLYPMRVCVDFVKLSYLIFRDIMTEVCFRCKQSEYMITATNIFAHNSLDGYYMWQDKSGNRNPMNIPGSCRVTSSISDIHTAIMFCQHAQKVYQYLSIYFMFSRGILGSSISTDIFIILHKTQLFKFLGMYYTNGIKYSFRTIGAFVYLCSPHFRQV